MAKKLAKKKSVTNKVSKKVKIPSVSKPYTKTELLQSLADNTELPKKKVREFIEVFQAIMFAHAKAGHIFSLPGVFKSTVVKKPAKKARKGINPFTKEPTMFRAVPARKVIKLKPLKKLKAAV